MPKAYDDTANTPLTTVVTGTPVPGDVSAAKNAFQFSDSNGLAQEHWFKTHWRPAMAYLYMAICAFDFILFPLLSMVLPIVPHTGSQYVVWHPITLEGGALLHLAFGSILSITSYGRSREKISGAISEA